jgi:phosphotransferase system HPr (HPr) family protein
MTARPGGSSLRPAASDQALVQTHGVPDLQASAEAIMSAPTLQRKVTITNPLGFHLRPIAAFARLAAQYQSVVTISTGERRVNGKSTLELMLLAAEQGTELILEVTGNDAAAAIEPLSALLATPSVDDETDDALPAKS